jgi:hypothetical protein
MNTPQADLAWAPPAGLPDRANEAFARWFWVGALAAGVAVCGLLAVGAAFHQVSFEPTSDAVYTAWVYRPEISGYLAAAVPWFVGGILMTVPVLKVAPRVLIVVVVAALSVVAAWGGVSETHARRHLDAALLATITSIRVPGAVAGTVGPTDPRPLRSIGGTNSPPGFSRVWTVSQPTQGAACAAERAVTRTGWAPLGGDCTEVRVDGLVRSSVSARQAIDGSWSVVVSVEPAYS